MPQVFKVGPYLVYFWINESEPLEPVHVHVAAGRPEKSATKIWLTQAGGCVLAHNGSKIPAHVLRNIMDIIETQNGYIVSRWLATFGSASYYC